MQRYIEWRLFQLLPVNNIYPRDTKLLFTRPNISDLCKMFLQKECVFSEKWRPRIKYTINYSFLSIFNGKRRLLTGSSYSLFRLLHAPWHYCSYHPIRPRVPSSDHELAAAEKSVRLIEPIDGSGKRVTNCSVRLWTYHYRAWKQPVNSINTDPSGGRREPVSSDRHRTNPLVHRLLDQSLRRRCLCREISSYYYLDNARLYRDSHERHRTGSSISIEITVSGSCHLRIWSSWLCHIMVERRKFWIKNKNKKLVKRQEINLYFFVPSFNSINILRIYSNCKIYILLLHS